MRFDDEYHMQSGCHRLPNGMFRRNYYHFSMVDSMFQPTHYPNKDVEEKDNNQNNEVADQSTEDNK